MRNSQIQDQSQSQSYVGIGNDDNFYVIENIVDKRNHHIKGKQYLVKWEGWNSSDNTWEPPQYVNHLTQVLQQFQMNWRKKHSGEDTPQYNSEEEQTKVKGKGKDKDKRKQKQKKTKNIEKEQKKKFQRKQSAPQKRTQRQEEKSQKSKVKVEAIELSSGQQSGSQSSSSQEGEVSQPKPRKKFSQTRRPDIKRQEIKKTQVRRADQIKIIPDTKVARINTIYINDKQQVFYEVDLENKEGKCIGVKLITSIQMKRKYEGLLAEYLQDYLKQEERLSMTIR